MKTATTLVAVCLVAMVGGLAYGFLAGDGFDEVRTLLGSPWFVVSLIDVYVGFILIAIWIAYRDRPLPAALWIVLLFVLGNAVSCLYALIALTRCSGDWRRFWLGRHADA